MVSRTRWCFLFGLWMGCTLLLRLLPLSPTPLACPSCVPLGLPCQDRHSKHWLDEMVSHTGFFLPQCPFSFMYSVNRELRHTPAIDNSSFGRVPGSCDKNEMISFSVLKPQLATPEQADWVFSQGCMSLLWHSLFT